MNTDGMIEITGVDVRQFIRECYDRSRPQGLGFIHAVNGPIPENEIDDILTRRDKDFVFDMDYVLGRAVKMTVFRDGGKMFIHNNWYDHSGGQLRDLLTAIGMADKADQVKA